MNNHIFEVVVKNFQQIVDESNIEIVVNEETELNRNFGIDSLGIVTLILGIEEDLGVNLDDYLADIRNARNVEDLVEIIEKAVC